MHKCMREAIPDVCPYIDGKRRIRIQTETATARRLRLDGDEDGYGNGQTETKTDPETDSKPTPRRIRKNPETKPNSSKSLHCSRQKKRKRISNKISTHTYIHIFSANNFRQNLTEPALFPEKKAKTDHAQYFHNYKVCIFNESSSKINCAMTSYLRQVSDKTSPQPNYNRQVFSDSTMFQPNYLCISTY